MITYVDQAPYGHLEVCLIVDRIQDTSKAKVRDACHQSAFVCRLWVEFCTLHEVNISGRWIAPQKQSSTLAVVVHFFNPFTRSTNSYTICHSCRWQKRSL